MRKRIILLLLVFLMILTGCLQEANQNQTNKAVEVNLYDIQLIEETLVTLTSNLHRGRLAGTEGNEKTIQYIVEKFLEIGIEPYKNDSYFHEYRQTVYHPDKQQQVLIIEFEDGITKEYVYGQDYVERNSMVNLEFTAPITFDLKDDQLKEKIVVLDNISHTQGLQYGAVRGFLVKSNIFLKSGLVRNDVIPLFQITEEVYDEICSKNIKSAVMISKSVGEEMKLKNVVGKIPGRDSQKALVLSAHFDHIGWAGETIFRGAVDNASGVAALLDLAQNLKEYVDDHELDMDILICGFNGEENGLFGSRAFVTAIKREYEEIWNINIDCIGKKDGGALIIAGEDKLNKKFKEILGEYFKKHGFDFEFAEMYGSDHLSFNYNNFVGVSVGQSNLDGIHTQKDSIEIVDYLYIKKVSNAIFDYITNH